MIFIVALLAGDGGPEGIPFGRYVRESGLAIPLVGLFFGAIWFFPLITALVAGDIVAAEDANGTLKTILTRSVERWQVFAGQGARRAHLRVRGAASSTSASGLFVGGLVWGFDPLISLSGTPISVSRGLVLIGGAALAYFMPMIAVASIALLLSTLTRNSAAAVVGTLMISLIMQLLGVDHRARLPPAVPAVGAVQRLAGAAARADRLGADRCAPRGSRPRTRCPALAVAFTAFLRRDVAGG